MGTRRRFSGESEAKVALEALRGDETIQEIATRHKIHPNQVSTWKQRAVEGMKEVFTKGAERGRGGARGGDPRPAREDRGAAGGAGFFGQRAQVVSREKRRAMIRRDHPRLSLSRQCRLLRVSRSSLYHRMPWSFAPPDSPPFLGGGERSCTSTGNQGISDAFPPI